MGISLQACLLQIVGYRNLIADVEKLRRESYDSDNPQHEEMLLKVSPWTHFSSSLRSANVAKPLLCARHWSGCEGNKCEHDMNTELRGKAYLSLLVQMLKVNFSIENSCEKLKIKPLFMCNLKRYQRWFLWPLTFGSSLDCLELPWWLRW